MRKTILKRVNELQVSNFAKELLILLISCVLGLAIVFALLVINSVCEIPYAGDNFSKFAWKYCFAFCFIIYIGFKTTKQN